MRLWATSDLHVDFAANAAFIQGLSRREYTDDAILVAGDVAHQTDRIRWALGCLRERFAQVFYVPGNHELWCRERGADSVERCAMLEELCAQLGVHTQPGWAGTTWVVPLLSWYDGTLGDGSASSIPRTWADHRYCRWPAAVVDPAAHFAGRNLRRLTPPSVNVVSFSHFLPRADLLPPRSVLRFRGLPAVAGSTCTEAQLRRLGAHTHVFGHSHIDRDLVRNGVRYVQQSLGYPRERRGRAYELKLLG